MENKWVCGYINYEEKQHGVNDLELGFLRLKDNKTQFVSLYASHPCLIPSHDLSKENLEKLLKNPNVKQFSYKIFWPWKTSQKDLDDIEKYQIPLQPSENPRLVLHLRLPYDRDSVAKLPNSLLQKGSFTRNAKRELNLQDRFINMPRRLEEILDFKVVIDNKQENLESETREIVKKFSKDQDYSYISRISGLVLDYLNNNVQGKPHKIVKKILEADDIHKLVKLNSDIKYSVDAMECLLNKEQLIYNSEKRSYELRNFNLNLIQAQQQIDEHYIRNLVRVDIDTEKPLFKTDEEKELIDKRETLLKEKNKANPYQFLLMEKEISEIEKKLTWKLDGLEVKLFAPMYDAQVSWATLRFKLENDSELKELHTIHKVKDNFVNEYKVYHYKNEQDLVEGVKLSIKNNRTYLINGHNIPYDIVSLENVFRDRSEFDIGTKKRAPRRDYVRKSEQRLNINLIQVNDTWKTSEILWPFLKFKEHGRSHRLSDVVKYLTGKKLKKYSYIPELRNLEIKALNNDEKSIKELAEYATNDVNPLELIFNQSLKIILKIKSLSPSLTFSEAAFSPGALKRLHEDSYFARFKNYRFEGYSQKRRENEVQIAKKRIKSKREELLRLYKINQTNEKIEDVTEYYFPLELLTLKFSLHNNPRLELLNIDDNEKLPIAISLSRFNSEELVDYYFVSRELDMFNKRIKERKLEKVIFKELNDFRSKMYNDKNILHLVRSLYSSLDFAKNDYRSFYVPSPESLQRKLRIEKETATSQLSFGFEAPIEEDDKDLLLLFNLNEKLLPKNVLKDSKLMEIFRRFKSTYKTLLETREELKKFVPKEQDYLPDLHVQYERFRRRHQEFSKVYKVPYEVLNDLIKQSYQDLSLQLKETKSRIVKIKGNYFFIKGPQNPRLTSLIPIHYFDKLELKEEDLELKM